MENTTLGVTQQDTQYRRRWTAVVAIGLSLFISALDATIVALALPPIATSFHLSDSLVALVTLAYAIPLTLLVLPAGSFVNRFRSLPMFLSSVTGFGLSSVVCGFAPSFIILLAGRIVQGSSAAVIGTQGFALAGTVVSQKERGKAMAVVGTIAPLGAVAGPGIGGLLLASFGWSWIFFVNLPVVLAASILGLFSLRGVRVGSYRPSGNVYREMVGLLRRSQYLFGLLSFFSSVSVAVTVYYLLPFDLGGIQQIPVALSGAIFLAVPLGMIVMGMAGGYLTDKYGSRPIILIGSGLLFVSSLLLSQVVSSRTNELDLAWRLFLLGSGIGLFSSPNQAFLIGFGGRESMAASSALSNFSARLGTVFAPAVVGASWALLASLSAQITVGMIFAVAFALGTFLFAILSVKNLRHS